MISSMEVDRRQQSKTTSCYQTMLVESSCSQVGPTRSPHVSLNWINLSIPLFQNLHKSCIPLGLTVSWGVQDKNQTLMNQIMLKQLLFLEGGHTGMIPLLISAKTVINRHKTQKHLMDFENIKETKLKLQGRQHRELLKLTWIQSNRCLQKMHMLLIWVQKFTITRSRILMIKWDLIDLLEVQGRIEWAKMRHKELHRGQMQSIKRTSKRTW